MIMCRHTGRVLGEIGQYIEKNRSGSDITETEYYVQRFEEDDGSHAYPDALTQIVGTLENQMCLFTDYACSIYSQTKRIIDRCV